MRDVRKEERMKRIGKCNKCGNCCRELRFFFPGELLKNPEFTEFYHARGIEVREFKGTGMLAVIIPHVCPQLGDDNLCKIQKRKPKACRAAPRNPWDHGGLDCGYGWKI
jgi:Fe-S-cluster containining protein